MTTVVDEPARAALLKEAALAAKMTDMDLLFIAKRGLSPSDAVADLKTRYPGAFEIPAMTKYKDMTPTEQAAFCKANGVRQVGR